MNKLGRIAGRVVITCFLLQVFAVLIGPPRALVDWLSGENLPVPKDARYVIILGGGGVPSDSTLLRLWHAAQFGRGLTNATFIVSLPADESPEQSSVGRMRDELVLRGIPAEAIQMETHGRNTHEQVVNIAQLIGRRDEPVVVVTSGFHMRRALLSLRKAGLTHVEALPAYSIVAEADAGPNLWLRYSIWNNWAQEADIARELAALCVYKLRGWI